MLARSNLLHNVNSRDNHVKKIWQKAGKKRIKRMAMGPISVLRKNSGK
jgi:hypothetical protein